MVFSIFINIDKDLKLLLELIYKGQNGIKEQSM